MDDIEVFGSPVCRYLLQRHAAEFDTAQKIGAQPLKMTAHEVGASRGDFSDPNAIETLRCARHRYFPRTSQAQKPRDSRKQRRNLMVTPLANAPIPRDKEE
jgi:hypothetical protein